jgi:hypothetical protein
MSVKQSSNKIFMVEPGEFYSNPQTEGSNHYQSRNEDDEKQLILDKALIEFHNFKSNLEKNGVDVVCLKGIEGCPDHIFPNWFTTFENKTMQIFPMNAENRRKEKTPEMINKLCETYKIQDDYSHLELRDIFLESTSSMVLDRVNRVVYATPSPRTNEKFLNEWCKKNVYDLCSFKTISHTDSDIYHTDVLMYVGTEIIGISFDVIDKKDRDRVKKKVSKNHKILEITADQVLEFCGNSLEVEDKNGNLMLAMSSRAHSALNAEQKGFLSEYYERIIHSDLATIEKYGGGSARCMLSELF